jgi:hypothetical protein
MLAGGLLVDSRPAFGELGHGVHIRATRAESLFIPTQYLGAE